MNRGFLLKSCMTVMLGAVLGRMTASFQIEEPLKAGVVAKQPAANSAATLSSDLKCSGACHDGITRSDLVELAKQNQFVSAQAAQAGKKPNIIVLWGDDIGVHNISAYNHGIMGYQTPNIDRIAKEGALFTDAYSQQSCTAGRASFILGQHPFRTGLLTIGMPGSTHGIPDWTPTTADLLKGQGYVTGQFGKNHLGDQDKHLPTLHGFRRVLW